MMVAKAAFKITVGYGNCKGGRLTGSQENQVSFCPPFLGYQWWMLMALHV